MNNLAFKGRLGTSIFNDVSSCFLKNLPVPDPSTKFQELEILSTLIHNNILTICRVDFSPSREVRNFALNFANFKIVQSLYSKHLPCGIELVCLSAV